MTKQEIREGIARNIQAETVGGYLEHWEEFKELLTEEQQWEYFLYCADVIMEKQSSQGVVVKVERELPLSISYGKDPPVTIESVVITPEIKRLIKALKLVAVEPLIPETPIEEMDIERCSWNHTERAKNY